MTTIERRPSPLPVEPSARDTSRVRVFANLMPDEIVAKRRGRSMQRRVVLGLAFVLVLLIAGYGFSWLQTHTANDELSSAQAKAVALAEQQAKFAPLVNAQQQADDIQEILGSLMAGDLQWSRLLQNIRGEADGGVAVSAVTGNVTIAATAPAAGTSGGLSVLNETGQAEVGSLTITGTAPSKNAVAQFVDRLATVHGLTAAFPASVTSESGTITFSVNVLLTSDVLGGRFTLQAETPGGN